MRKHSKVTEINTKASARTRNYIFECDWLFELSNNKLSDDNLTSELVENRTFLNQSQARKS